ncbi:hypothetical protein QJQ45_027546, partial [Haematococcus lacustris]
TCSTQTVLRPACFGADPSLIRRICREMCRFSAGLVALILIAVSVEGFKEHEFKKCNDAGFCRRNRGKSGYKYSIDATTIAVSGPTLSATLSNSAAPGKHFALSLTAYTGGFIRLHVDESPSTGRYQVSDVTNPGIEQHTSNWTVSSKDAKAAVLSAGHMTVDLKCNPFRLTFSSHGKAAVTLNSRDMFHVEHRRTKEDADGSCDGCWEETFLSHTDSKPKGPEALSLDIGFPGADHVYGLPERATSLALKPTTGGGWLAGLGGRPDPASPCLTLVSILPNSPPTAQQYLAPPLPWLLLPSAVPEDVPAAAAAAGVLGGVPGEPYRLYNLDVFEYLHESPFGLYGSIPFMLAHKMGQTSGVFWLNAAEMFVDVSKAHDGSASQWVAESGVVDLFVFLGPRPQQVVQQYALVTGTTALPQLFAIGYHQCRWNYKDEADVKAVDGGFDTHAIPYDVLWLDIEHTVGKRYLTWDSSLFPNPVGMQEDVASRGRKMVTIVDPHVKRDPGYYIFAEAEAAKHYVRNKHGTDFDGWCWPGSSSYLDVTSPVVREWWAQQFTVDKYQGSTQHLYIWNDMNEPSVFNGPEITMPKDNLHYGDVEHRDVHNVFGLYYHQGTAEGLVVRGYKSHGPDGDRPFVLSRAFYAGTQRVGPIWTGDNTANWDHLRVSVPMLTTLGLTGLPFSGADVGGFFGNPDAELLTRWYQLGTFYPFFRGHAHIETQRREPWLFGEPYTTRIRDAIRARYALLPYIYTLFRQANLTGAPVVAPVWYEFPDNKDTFALDEQLMLGPSLMVRPVTSAGASSAEVMLPRTSRWFHTLSGQEMEKATWLPGLDQWFKVQVSPDTIPAYYRGGHVVPLRERPRRSSATQSRDPLTLVVALDHQQEAAGELYMDDGRSFAFLNGQFMHRRLRLRLPGCPGCMCRAFAFQGHTLRCSPASGAAAGSWSPPGVKVERIAFLGLTKKGSFQVKMPDGQVVPLEQGPLSQRAPAAMNAHILRAPWLDVSQDWSLELVVRL